MQRVAGPLARRLHVCRQACGDLDMNILAPRDGADAPSRVQSYNATGFTVNGSRIAGAIALLPKHRFQWMACPLRGWQLN